MYPQAYSVPMAVPVAVPAEPGAGLATTSLIMGILALVTLLFVWVPVCGWIAPTTLGILGIIFGALGRKSVSRHGQAIAGLVMSIIAVGLQIAWIVIYYAVIVSALSAAAGGGQ
jgi:hypothetical protein